MWIHPAESRIRRLAAEMPARLLLFDLLVDEHGHDLTALALGERRERLAAFMERAGPGPMLELSPSSSDRGQAERWMKEYAAFGCDGVISKRARERYHSGDREAMRKIKRLRTAQQIPFLPEITVN